MSDTSTTAFAGEAAVELPSLQGGTHYFEGNTHLVIQWWIDGKQAWPKLMCSLYTCPMNEASGLEAPGIGTRVIALDPWSGAHAFEVERPQTGSDSTRINPDDARASGHIYLGGLLAMPSTPVPDFTRKPQSPPLPVYLHVHCRLDGSRWFRAKIAQGSYVSFFPSLQETNTPDDVATPPADEPATPTPVENTPDKPVRSKR